jgi:hypothetical protein
MDLAGKYGETTRRYFETSCKRVPEITPSYAMQLSMTPTTIPLHWILYNGN